MRQLAATLDPSRRWPNRSRSCALWGFVRRPPLRRKPPASNRVRPRRRSRLSIIPGTPGSTVSSGQASFHAVPPRASGPPDPVVCEARVELTWKYLCIIKAHMSVTMFSLAVYTVRMSSGLVAGSRSPQAPQVASWRPAETERLKAGGDQAAEVRLPQFRRNEAHAIVMVL
ncbi:hypothetical protein EDB87DRAFT_890343 [Lactarius vividus]|nr:hypothetical protein EDB87DRAFT_890343 [Lactarius vividus]